MVRLPFTNNGKVYVLFVCGSLACCVCECVACKCDVIALISRTKYHLNYIIIIIIVIIITPVCWVLTSIWYLCIGTFVILNTFEGRLVLVFRYVGDELVCPFNHTLCTAPTLLCECVCVCVCTVSLFRPCLSYRHGMYESVCVRACVCVHPGVYTYIQNIVITVIVVKAHSIVNSWSSCTVSLYTSVTRPSWYQVVHRTSNTTSEVFLALFLHRVLVW